MRARAGGTVREEISDEEDIIEDYSCPTGTTSVTVRHSSQALATTTRSALSFDHCASTECIIGTADLAEHAWIHVQTFVVR